MSSFSSLSLDNYADLIQCLVCLSVILNAVQFLSTRRQYSTHGLFNYEVLKTTYRWLMHGRIAALLNPLLDYPNYLYLRVVQLIAALLLLSHLVTGWSLPLILLILLISLLSRLREQFGLNGSDQMQVIILTSLAIFSISPDLFVKQACLLFICCQALLSYLTGGISKLISPMWRNGTAITYVLSTESYGSASLSGTLRAHATVAKLLCWSIIVFECTFAPLALLDPRICLVLLGAGCLFHIMIAVCMGLNDFVWTFIATYPAIFYVSSLLQPFLHRIVFLHHLLLFSIGVHCSSEIFLALSKGL